jgi:hypothetical protein
MYEAGIRNGVLTEENAYRIYNAFQTLFRPRSSTIVLERQAKVTLSQFSRHLKHRVIFIFRINAWNFSSR